MDTNTDTKIISNIIINLSEAIKASAKRTTKKRIKMPNLMADHKSLGGTLGRKAVNYLIRLNKAHDII
jgi:hypothetical protein